MEVYTTLRRAGGLVLVLLVICLAVGTVDSMAAQQRTSVFRRPLTATPYALDIDEQGMSRVVELAGVFAAANPNVSGGAALRAALSVIRNADEVFTVDVIMAWLRVESGYRYDCVSTANARGVAQIQPETGRWMAGIAGCNWNEDWLIEDPSYSIDLGVYYLRWLYQLYEGDLHSALTAYNRGVGGLALYVREHGTAVSDYSAGILHGAR